MADILEEYQRKIGGIEGLKLRRGRGGWSVSVTTKSNDPKTAAKEVRIMQRQLRALKKELAFQMRTIRSQYQQRIASQTYSPGIGGTLLGAKYRGAMRRAGAAEKRKLRAQYDSTLHPYQQAKAGIDQLLEQSESFKMKLQLKS